MTHININHSCQLITTTTTTVDPAAAAYPPLHLYHRAHPINTRHHHTRAHPHAAAKWLQTAYLGRNAGPNDVTVVWALGKPFF